MYNEINPCGSVFLLQLGVCNLRIEYVYHSLQQFQLFLLHNSSSYSISLLFTVANIHRIVAFSTKHKFAKANVSIGIYYLSSLEAFECMTSPKYACSTTICLHWIWLLSNITLLCQLKCDLIRLSVAPISVTGPLAYLLHQLVWLGL